MANPPWHQGEDVIHSSITAALLFGATLAGCAGPPTAQPSQVLGHGTPGVESYGLPGRTATLADLQDRCRAVPDTPDPPRPQTLAAACDQLRRTLHNQPGSALARTP
ncbi:MAG: hypothetical protein INR62_10280 [Rhodospirillales bacterium]|nr:hypothetical protein [Acetobacter sp.]